MKSSPTTVIERPPVPKPKPAPIPKKEAPAPERPISDQPAANTDADVFARFSRPLGKDAFRYVPAIVVPAVASFASVAIFTRIFPPVAYGHFALIMGVAGILISALGGWLQQSVLRYLPRYRQENGLGEFMIKLSGVLGIELALLAAVSSILYPVLGIARTEYANFYFPGVVLVLSWIVFVVYNAAFQANMQSAQFAKYQILQAAARLVFSLLFVFIIGRDVLSLLIGTTVSYALLTAPMAFQLGLTRPGVRLSRAIDTAFAKRVTLYGLPLVGSMVAGTVLELSHRFVINLYKGPEQVGIFTANYNVAILVVGFVAGPILFAAEPMIVNTWESRDRSKVQGIISTLSRYLMLLALPIGCFIAAYAELIASVAFGEAFREGFPVISFVVFGMILFQFGMYGHKILKLVEKTRVMFGLVAVCAIANIALNFALVPGYGYWGAAIASLISYGLYPVMVYFVAKRYMPWLIPWRSLAKIGAASLVATAVWLVTRPLTVSGVADWVQIGGSTMAGAIVYVAALVLLGEVRAYEKNAVRAGMAMLRGKLVH